MSNYYDMESLHSALIPFILVSKYYSRVITFSMYVKCFSALLFIEVAVHRWS